ncbi:hypothetical protein CFP56_025528 [Quercus suber]|uniref:At2g29880-like C-terminal domain-containing protein n=1 Tax=Quercus suber TaxID=58331 RepID=A0AAW0K3S0_QUESU
MEINNDTLGMGIGNIIGDTQRPAGDENLLLCQPHHVSKKFREPLRKRHKRQLEGKPCLEDKDYSSIKCIVVALQTVPNMDDEIFLEVCELLENERKAKMFVAMDVTAQRKWLLKKLQR